MAFMKPEYVKDAPYHVESSTSGCWIVPSYVIDAQGADRALLPPLKVFQDYVEGTPIEVKRLPVGYICRLSASGYLDCTDWDYFDTELHAREYVREHYEVDPDTGDELDEEDGDDE
jgi:hypothetical protein